MDNWRRIEELFLWALDHPPEARTRFLDSACDGDAELRREVSELLEADAADSLSEDELIGCEIGAYRIVREIGRGGMDSDELLRRFRHERQILAQLDHPYITRLLDGGTLPDGRTYFVMEYADGKPIPDYCAEQKLTVGQRAALFCKVCKAVSYAHRNLVIHRDLKPGNILVAADGSPRLLDFGIAKLMNADGSRPICTTQASERLKT